MAGAGAISTLFGWMLLVFGHTMIITHSKIFAPLRQRLDLDHHPFFGWLLTCPQCMGFWVGAFWSLFNVAPWAASFHFGWPGAFAVLGASCASSGSTYLLAKLLFHLDPEPPVKIVSAIRRRPLGPMHMRRP